MPTFGKDEPIVSYNFDACTKKLQASQNARKRSGRYIYELPASPKHTGGKALKKKRTRLSLPTPLCIERYEASEESKHFSSDEENERETTMDENPFSSLLAAPKVSVSTCDSTHRNCETKSKENANSRPGRWDTITCEKRQAAKVSRAAKKRQSWPFSSDTSSSPAIHTSFLRRKNRQNTESTPTLKGILERATKMSQQAVVHTENEGCAKSHLNDDCIDELADDVVPNELHHTSAYQTTTLDTTRVHKEIRRQKAQADIKVKGLLGDSIQKAQRSDVRDFALLRMQSTNSSSYILECNIRNRPFLVVLLKNVIHKSKDMAVYESDFIRKEVGTQQTFDIKNAVNQSISTWDIFIDSGCKSMQLIVTPPQRHTFEHYFPSTLVQVYAPCFFNKLKRVPGCPRSQWCLWTRSLLTVNGPVNSAVMDMSR